MDKKKLTREEFCEEIINRGLAPSEYDASKYDFRKHLAGILNRYLELLDELDEDERPVVFYATWEETKQMISDLNYAINESVKAYYNGRHSKAYECLKKGITKRIIKESLSFSCGHFKNFYRMRESKNNEGLDYKKMFHIPFNLRTRVATQRFSAPGYPCLYLGSSVYVCWEEMRRPNLDKYYVSRFNTKYMFVYDLSLPSKNYIIKFYEKLKNDENAMFHEQPFHNLLLRLPLILACMVKVAKPDDPFKPEYIIPQLFMEWVIEEESEEESEMIHGIAYTSVHKSDEFNFAPEEYINFAFPAFPPIKGNYSEKLCEGFLLTEPTCCKPEKERSNEDMIEIFGQLEARLKDEEKFPLKKIDG